MNNYNQYLGNHRLLRRNLTWSVFYFLQKWKGITNAKGYGVREVRGWAGGEGQGRGTLQLGTEVMSNGNVTARMIEHDKCNLYSNEGQ